MFDIDDLLERIKDLSAHIDRLAPTDPERVALEAERELLRADARQAVGPAASPAWLRYELKHLRRRLAQMDDEPIEGPSAANNPMAWTDHLAFARRINDMISDKTGDERESVETQIAEIERQLGDIERKTS